MIFTEPRFVAFFLLVLGVHWALAGHRARKLWLLACSAVFYGAWDWRFLGLIGASTLVDYVAALRIDAAGSPRGRRGWLLVSVVANLGLLGSFKYFNFFADSAADFSAWLGLPLGRATLDVVLPVGISFYTFQTMSYTLDVWRRQLAPTRDLADFALFVSFFPQLVAGPIVRARDFLPQLDEPRRFARIDVRAALVLFLVGFFKKAVVSDGIAATVDAYFADPAGWDGASAWLGTWLYAAQIYCDFSGYSDMAIGCAGLLGYELCPNFDFPYLATDIADFWRRWHVSLSTWLRDYLYIPLGGSRAPRVAGAGAGTAAGKVGAGERPASRLRTARNLMLTMLLGGLWHGAAWRFVLWGGLHGLALVAQRGWRGLRGDRPVPGGGLGGALRLLPGRALTLAFVGFCWIFFRAPDMERALAAARGYLGFGAGGGALLGDRLAWLLLALALLHLLARTGVASRAWRRLPGWAFTLGYGVAGAVVLTLVHPHAEPFIYFQF